MSDKYEELNNEDDNVIESTGKVVEDKVSFDIEHRNPDGEVRSIDDALRIVDNSDLPPAPNSIRQDFSTATPPPASAVSAGGREKPAVSGQRVDKYGLPIQPPPQATRASADKSLVPSPPVVPVPVMRPAGEAKSLASIDTKLLGEKEPEAGVPRAKKPGLDIGPENFKMKFDFESAYKDPPENRPLRRRRERRTGLVGGLMLALFILCVGVVMASIMWMATIDVLGFASEDEPVDVQVPEGFEMEDITDMLYEAGLIRYKALFNLFADYSSAEEKIVPGSYVLNKNYDYRALVQGMTARAGIRVETTVTIPEGFTLAQIFNLLEDEQVCSADDLWDAATYHDFNFYFLDKETLGNKLRLEGFLFPDTYNFYKDSTPVQAITKMLRQFDNIFTDLYVERAGYLGYTVSEIITIASMIEREAGDDDERPRIAAVIYNRLNNSGTYPMLEIDATFRYAVAGTNIPPSPQVDSIYNTYLHPGLPPGPIANPGEASIRAALYPASTNEYFYALNLSGTHNFFRTAAEHSAFVNSSEFGG